MPSIGKCRYSLSQDNVVRGRKTTAWKRGYSTTPDSRISSLKTATSIIRVQNGEKDGKTRMRVVQPVDDGLFEGFLPSFDRRRSVRGLRRSMLFLRWVLSAASAASKFLYDAPTAVAATGRTCGGPAGSSMLRLPALGGHLIGRLRVNMERPDRSTAGPRTRSRRKEQTEAGQRTVPKVWRVYRLRECICNQR
ncbi:hypothetical protein E4U51_000415 [Claviceps purpurea]|nr:hypothetical protein E4U51_000415 [Claviceps purpurea]